MVALKLQNFGGMVPVMDNRLLPENQAAFAEDVWLASGAVEGFRQLTYVYDLATPATTNKVFRIPKQNYTKEFMADSYWLEFEHPYTDCLRTPSIGDTYERFYWCSPTESPTYNTKARIASSSAPYILGIPAPTVAPGVSVVGGGAPTETRAYVYTWVSLYGEEGPPSPPTLVTGNASGTWNITTTAPGAAATGRALDRTRIYRTITGASGATTYYYVGDMAIGTTAYADTAATTVVAANNILESVFYEPPPTDLQGMTAMPNGIIAGFRANEVWFCEPYLPHAWPSTYTIGVEGSIVGLGVTGQTLVVLTTGSPYNITGINPATMTVSKMAYSEPCLSRGSIVSTPTGVVYASPNGLAVANAGSVQIVTRNVFSKDDWLDETQVPRVSRLRASILDNSYHAWGSPARGSFEETAFEPTAFNQVDDEDAYQGFYLDITNPRISYVRLATELATINCFSDVWTGETLIIRDGQVGWIDIAPSRPRRVYNWKSKVFETPNKRNFEAMRVYFDDSATAELLGGTFAGGEWEDTETWEDSGYWYDGITSIFGIIRVYADNRLVYQRDMRASGEFMRLPSGFKATYWQVEIEARTSVYSVEMATTAKELGSV